MIYFDNNATTSVSNEVFSAMTPYLTSEFGNPSSMYAFGSRIKKALNIARSEVANLLSATSDEIVFTSGGSESNCLAIMTCIRSAPEKKKIITSAVEHASIMEQMRSLEHAGYEVIYLPVDAKGKLNVNDLINSIDSNTCVVSIMLANNETGNIHNIQELSAVAKSYGVPMHTDAVQGAGKIHIDVNQLGVDYLSISGHKFHAPKGVGALYVRSEMPLFPLIYGHQERGYRGGTENVASIIGLGTAARISLEKMDYYTETVTKLRDYFEDKLMEICSDVVINGDKESRIANTTNFSFYNLNGEEIILFLASKGICVSTGSACNSVLLEPSYVLSAMGVQKEYIRSIRVSFSDSNTKEEIDYVIEQLRLAYNNFKKIKERKNNGGTY